MSSSSINNIVTHFPPRISTRDLQQSADGVGQNRAQQVPDQSGAQVLSDLGHHRHVNRVGNDQTQVTDANQSVGAALAYQSVATSLHSSFDLQVTTQEGDVVTIGFSADSAHKQSIVQAQNANGQVAGLQDESSESSNFNISVQGNLSEAEKKSLGDLVGQLQKVGSSFFQGQTQNAFQQAQNVGFDAGQIAGFSLSLNVERSAQAVSAYQQSDAQQSALDPSSLRQLAGFFNQSLNDLSGAPSALQPFPNPADLFQQLSSGVSEAVASQTAPSSDQAQHLDTLQRLLNLVGNLVLNPNAPNNPAPPPLSDPANGSSAEVAPATTEQRL